MSDYISREAALEAFENADADVREDYRYGACDWGFGMKNIQKVLNSVPTADVEPVRRGRWVNKKGGFFEFAACSLCGEVAPTAGIIPNYCPSCGAKMELEDENDEN